MKRFTAWLTTKYLPAYARERLVADNNRLDAENAALRHQLARERSYSAGLEYALKRRVHINIEKGG